MNTDKHPIQMSILKQLIINSQCRYNQLNVNNVDGNIFVHHLKKLFNDGYIEKKGISYGLTQKGKIFVSDIDTQKAKINKFPRTDVLIVALNSEGQYLFYERTKEPFAGKIGFPAGKVKYSESIQQAAKREFEEETGLKANLKLKGIIENIYTEDQDVPLHFIDYIFVCHEWHGQLIKETYEGKNFWSFKDEIDEIKFYPNLLNVINLIETNKTLFFEIFDYRE